MAFGESRYRTTRVETHKSRNVVYNASSDRERGEERAGGEKDIVNGRATHRANKRASQRRVPLRETGIFCICRLVLSSRRQKEPAVRSSGGGRTEVFRRWTRYEYSDHFVATMIVQLKENITYLK